jgi:Holliday junction resolvase
MAHPSKRKANRHEREIVRTAEAKGLEAERAYASNGESLGEVEACDVLVRGRDSNVMDALRIQAKRRKSIASYLNPPEGTDAVVVREDRGENLAILPLTDLLDLLMEE